MIELINDKKPTTKQLFWEWIGIPLAGGILIGFFQEISSSVFNWDSFIQSTLISAVFWSVLANGNGVIITLIDKRWSWLKQPVRRVIIGVVSMLTYTVIASLIVTYIYVALFFEVEFSEILKSQGLISLVSFPVLITFFISTFQHGRSFMLAWRHETIKVERLKTENIKSKFESLQTQVNPHFLFNSLNALTSLVYESPERAEEFIHKLSDVYRYILDHKNDEVVDLNSELEFSKSFIYLNKIRFGANFEAEYDIDSLDDWVIPPVTLQLIIENCLKHNVISMDQKLTIQIIKQGEYLTVKNNLNPLPSESTESHGLGLENIKTRYGLLTDKEVRIENKDDMFSISVPLLTIE